MDKRLSPAFITKLRSAVTYRREHARLLFSSEMYDYYQSLSEDGSDLYRGVKTNILNRFEQVTNRIEISSSAALLLNLVQSLKVTLILVLLKNSLGDRSIISKSCLVATHVLISFVTGISTIV